MKRTENPLKKILELTQDEWDHPVERAAVRDNFRKVCACRTPALGGEVYASAAAEKVFYHTCKSKCCPSCGNRGTLQLAARAAGRATRYIFRWHCPHHAQCLLAGLQSPSASTTRFASTRCCRAPAVGVEPVSSTLAHNRHTTYLRWASQPFSASPHDGFCWRTETSRSQLGGTIGV